MTMNDFIWLCITMYGHDYVWLCMLIYYYRVFQEKMGISEWFSVYFSAHSFEKRDPFVHVYVHTMYKIIFEQYQGGEKYIFYIIGFMCS